MTHPYVVLQLLSGRSIPKFNLNSASLSANPSNVRVTMVRSYSFLQTRIGQNIECSTVFHEDSVLAFGANCSCVIVNSSIVDVLLGTNAVLRMGDNIFSAKAKVGYSTVASQAFPSSVTVL
jgi:hypothetical protein